MSPSDVYDAANDLHKQGVPVDEAIVKGFLKTLDSFAGVGVSTYPPHESKTKTSATSEWDFGDKKSSEWDFGDKKSSEWDFGK